MAITTKHTFYVIAIILLILFQVVPRRVTGQNMFETQEVTLTSYGCPFNYATSMSVHKYSDKGTQDLERVYSIIASSLDLAIIVGAALLVYWRWNRTATKFRTIVMALLTVLSLSLYIYIGGLPILYLKVMRAHRINFAKDAIESLSKWAADSQWVEEQKNLIKKQIEEKQQQAPWLGEKFMLFKDGEWLAYVQGEEKGDNTINDLLIMKGAGENWYYTDMHICYRMWYFRVFNYSSPENSGIILNDPDIVVEVFTDRDLLYKRAIHYRGWGGR